MIRIDKVLRDIEEMIIDIAADKRVKPMLREYKRLILAQQRGKILLTKLK